MALSSITQATLLADLHLRLREASASVWTDAELKSYLNVAQYEVAVKLNGISDIWYGTEHVVITANINQAHTGILSYVDLSSLSILKVVNVLYVDHANSKIEVLPLVKYKDLIGWFNNSYFATTKYACALYGEKLYFTIPKTSLDIICSGVDSTANIGDDIDDSTDPKTVEVSTGYDHEVNDHVQIGSEIMRITAFSTSPTRELTLARAQWGSTIAAHSSNDDIYNMFFKIVMNYYRKPTEMDGSNGLDVPPEFQDLVLMFATAKAYEKLNQPQRKNQIEEEISAKLKEIKQSFLEGDSNDISPVKKSDTSKT